MRKILVGYLVDFNASGIDKYLINVIKIAYENNIHLDFLSSEYSKSLQDYLDDYGYKVFSISSLKKPFKQYREIKNILKSGGYDAAYFNISEPLNFIGAKAAHDLGVEVIVHSHSSRVKCESGLKSSVRGLLNWLCRPILSSCCDKCIACSQYAGQWLFSEKSVKSNKYSIIYNAVNSERFSRNNSVRKEMRDILKISHETLAIGFIGRFDYQKNNFFLVEIAKKLAHRKENFKMILIGDGPDFSLVKQCSEDLRLNDYIDFLGIRNDIDKLIQAFDVFILPSRYEGLPIVGVEAQFIGVPCIFSDKISPEIIFTDNSLSLSIDDADVWADEILKQKDFSEVDSDFKSIFSYDYQKESILEKILL